MSALSSLGPLIRIGWRSIRKAPLRSLLVFSLVAIVVAAGTVAAIANRSTAVNNDDVRASEFGAGDFRADFGVHRGFVDGPAGVPIPLPPEILLGPGDVPVMPQTSPSETELAAQQEADEAWFRQLDLGSVEAEIEDSLDTDVSIERRGQVDFVDGPFGSRGFQPGPISDLDLNHPVTAGTVSFVQGRAPQAPYEIAVHHQDRENRPQLGDEVTVGSQTLQVVGIVTNPSSRFQPITLVLPETFDRIVTPERGVSFAVRTTLPAGEDDAIRAANVVAAAVDRPISVRTPSATLVPENGDWVRHQAVRTEWEPGAVVPPIWPVLLTGLLATQIALVCAAAFAVGIRRRTKEFGQLMTLGADDRHILRLAQVEAALLGVLAAVVGLVVGIVASNRIISAGWMDAAGNRIPTEVRWSLVDWLGPAAVGIIAVIIAAWWPTRALQGAPIPGVLEGRLPTVAVRSTTPRRGLVLVAIGVVFLALSAELLTNGQGPQPPAGAYVLVTLGIITMIGGSLLLIGTILSIIGQRADRFPLLARLVVRNSDRQRSRSWVVVGAFIAALAMPIVIGASIKAYPDSYRAQETSAFEARLLTTSRIDITPFGPQATSAATGELADFDIDFGQHVTDGFAIAGETSLVVVPTAQMVWINGRNTLYGGGRVIAATDEVINLLQLEPDLTRELDNGSFVDVSTSRPGRSNGDPQLVLNGAVGTGVLDLIDGPPIFSQAWLASPDRLAELGAQTVSIGTVRLLAEPLSTADEETVRQLGNQLWVDRFGAFDYGRGAEDRGEVASWLDLQVSRSSDSGTSATTVRLWATLVSIGLALLVAFVTSALSAVEMTPEIQSMIATGASPSIRRRLLGAQTYYHLIVAAAMAVPLAVLAFWAASRADTYGRPNGLTVPWTSIAITAVVVPIIVAAVVTATFRNGKPAVSRRLS